MSCYLCLFLWLLSWGASFEYYEILTNTMFLKVFERLLKCASKFNNKLFHERTLELGLMLIFFIYLYLFIYFGYESYNFCILQS